jgi:hypothetical protein
MYRKDYFLNEIEKIALVRARFMGLKADGKADEFIQLADTTMLNEYGVPLPELLKLTIEDFETLLEEENYNADKLDALAHLIYLLAHPFTADPECLLMQKKVLVVFDLLERKYHRQSFENITKRNSIYQFIRLNYE